MSFGEVDIGLVAAAVTYVKHGLTPGGCGTYMLLGDLEGAKARCHKHALPVIDNTYAAVLAVVPELCRGDRQTIESWMSHDGLRGADAATKLQLQLSHGDLWRHND